ncbi:MAG: FMN-binding protein [Ruminococcus flavefaciens]|nr:FMN-binding protein [Ruminococcus flavefaciens]
MKKSKKVLLIISFVILCLFIAGRITIGNMIKNIQHITVSIPDLSDIQDGNYIGEYSITPVHVKVEVTVDNHKITNIAILQHDNGLGSKAESIVRNVIEEQSLDIDAVSGATVSSKCILKAVENAIGNEKGDLSE